MKFIKWTFLTAVILFGFLYLILQAPLVQKFIFEVSAKNAFALSINSEPNDGLRATVCGSGSPMPSDSAQTCIMIEAGKKIFIVDIGDGSAANLARWRVPMENLEAVFITHLHSDHIADLGDLHLMSWIARDRKEKLKVYGPDGIENVTAGFDLVYREDYTFRNEHHGNLIAPIEVTGYKPITIEGNSVVYDEDELKVTAFLVNHKPVDPAYGFRFDYKDRSIVMSGDTIYDENLITNARGADVLFHEAISNELTSITSKIAAELGEEFDNNPARHASEIFYHIQDYHTTPIDAALAASKSDVKLLVFYHLVPTPQGPVKKIMAEIFFRGVTEVFSNWEYAIDGTKVTLPLDSDEIIFNK